MDARRAVLGAAGYRRRILSHWDSTTYGNGMAAMAAGRDYSDQQIGLKLN
jgi:hypothetical protein